MATIPYSITETTITAVIGFAPRVVPKTHPNFDRIREALINGEDESVLEPLLSIPKAIEQFTGGDVLVKGGKLFYKGFEVKGSLAKLILGFSSEGKDKAAEPFKAFLANAFSNPDPRAATDLYDWVVNSELPITPDGHILAWKAVRDDYLSIHSGARTPQFNHKPGNTVEMDRTECDSNPNQTCSTGLHFCSASYLSNYAGGGHRVVAVKINPADVVAFPKDYGWSKGRACRYEIVGEVPLEQVKEFYPQGRIYGGFTVAAAPDAATNPCA
jgi:hypothetical protein